MEQKSSFSIVCLTLLLCSLTAVSQVQMSINPRLVVLGSSSPVNTTFTCTISSGTSIRYIVSMIILRKRETDLGSKLVSLVSNMYPNPAFHSTAPQDIVSRGSMSGGIYVNTPTSSTLTLSLSTQDVVCTDKGHYICVMTYKDVTGELIVVGSNETLSIYGMPHDVSLSASKNNIIIQGTGPGEAAADVNVGEVVEFACSAKIGSDNTTRLRWKKTSEFGNGTFISYQQPDDMDDGTSSSLETDCSFTRTATLRYNVTPCDANTNYDLAFQCYVSVAPPGQEGTVETQNPPTFYIDAIYPFTDTACDRCSHPVVAVVVVSTISCIVTVSAILIAIFIVRRKTAVMKNTYDQDETLANVTNEREEVSLDVRVNYDTENHMKIFATTNQPHTCMNMQYRPNYNRISIPRS